MEQKKQYQVSQEHAADRLDVFLTAVTGMSRQRVQEDINAKCIFVNDKLAKASYKVKEGDVIECRSTGEVQDVNTANIVVPNIPILDETLDYIVVNKPTGLLTHPTQAGESITLATELVKRYPEIAQVGESSDRPGIVHRLDKDASGVLVVARTPAAFDSLKKQFQERSLEKEYLVLVHGVVELDHGMIDFTIDRGEGGRMVSRPKVKELSLRALSRAQDGKEALTEYTVVERFSRHTLLLVRIHTGRTHQIRVHMYAFNHPVAGDTLYMNKKVVKKKDAALLRLFLHATRLCFATLTGEKRCYDASLPVELQNFLATLRKEV